MSICFCVFVISVLDMSFIIILYLLLNGSEVSNTSLPVFFGCRAPVILLINLDLEQSWCKYPTYELNCIASLHNYQAVVN